LRQAGDQGAGFTVELDERARVLRVRVWGFWREDLAAGFAPAITQECPVGQATTCVLDAGELKAQREAGQQAFAAFFVAVGRQGLTTASVRVSNALTKLQLIRISKENAMKGLSVQFGS